VRSNDTLKKLSQLKYYNFFEKTYSTWALVLQEHQTYATFNSLFLFSVWCWSWILDTKNHWVLELKQNIIFYRKNYFGEGVWISQCDLERGLTFFSCLVKKKVLRFESTLSGWCLGLTKYFQIYLLRYIMTNSKSIDHQQICSQTFGEIWAIALPQITNILQFSPSSQLQNLINISFQKKIQLWHIKICSSCIICILCKPIIILNNSFSSWWINFASNNHLKFCLIFNKVCRHVITHFNH